MQVTLMVTLNLMLFLTNYFFVCFYCDLYHEFWNVAPQGSENFPYLKPFLSENFLFKRVEIQCPSTIRVELN